MKDSNANDKLALLEKIQEGTTEALETIEMDGFDAVEQKETLEKKIKKGTSSGFVTILSQLQVAQITRIQAVDSTLMASQPAKIYKAGEEINIEFPERRRSGDGTPLPFMKIDLNSKGNRSANSLTKL